MSLTHNLCYMYGSCSCCFPCLVSLTETCLSHRVLKGEESLSVIINDFFSLYAISKKMCCVDHNGCDCHTSISHTTILLYACPKTLTGHWHVTDAMIHSTSCFQEKLWFCGLNVTQCHTRYCASAGLTQIFISL